MSANINDNVMEFLSHNVLYLRRTHNLTKKEMAKILGIGIKTLSKIEQGNNRLALKLYQEVYKTSLI